MANKTIVDKAISDLTQALQIANEDLFVLEQNGEAKKLKGATLLDFVTLNVVSVTVTTLPAGSSATATYDESTRTLALGIPQGPKGDTGAVGATGATGQQGLAGPANVLTIGSVTSGKVASATITGEAPNQVLNLVLEKGEQGETGAQGPRGETGATGPKGEPGPPGKDGVTPELVEGELVEVPSAGGGTDLSLGITGATVGQIAKITAVDGSGKPTAWSPVDMAGEKKAWTKIIDVEITEATMSFEATGLDNVTELYCEWGGLKTASETNKRDLDLYINDIAVGGGWVLNAGSNGQAMYGYSTSTYNGLVWYNTRSTGIAGASNAHNPSMGNNSKVSYGLVHGVGAARKVKIKAINADNAPVVGKLEVWAR